MSTAAPDRRQRPTGPAALGPRREPRPPDPGIAILVVDDTDRNLTALGAMLGDLDATVVTARSGEDALRVLLRQDFALILLDVRMPGMDGFETARLVRSRERNRHTPIIFLTAYSGQRDHELHGYALGAVDFLSKPVPPDVLRGKVSALIELHRKTEELRRQQLALHEAERRAQLQELESEQRRWREQQLLRQVERERQASMELQRANGRLRVIAKVVGELLRAPDPAGAAADVLAHAGELGAELALWYGGTPERLVAHRGIDAATAGQLAEAPAGAQDGALAQALAASAVAAFPLVAGERRHGLLAFATRGGDLAADDVAALALVADHVAEALERARLMTELARTADDLREAHARKDEFLAMLGHELRNPLVPVVSAVQLVQRRGTGDAAADRAVAAAGRQIGHMRRLLDDLLDVSRIQTGKIELRRSATDLRQVVEDALHETHGAVDARRHDLQIGLPDAPVLVDGDPVRLAQVVANLVHNAAKYTPAGGHVRLSVEREDGAAVLRVRDDGIGLAPDMLDRVFDLFVQVHGREHRQQGGLGIGLTLVRRLVELHGGTIVARSAGLGRGSEFEVRLPSSQEAAGVPAEPPARPDRRTAAGVEPLRVVVVEDDADNRDSLRALLQDLGHVVDAAEDGPSGIALVRERRPDVALVDIGLPGLDGYAVARELRRSCAPTRLVAMTGYGSADDRRAALDAGFHAHLVKPVDLADLGRALAGPTDEARSNHGHP